MAASVHIQSILYGNSLGDVWRFVRSLRPMIDHARADGLVGDVDVVLGDCSPHARLGPADVAELGTVLGEIDLQYRFFDANLMTAKGHNTLAEGVETDRILVINPDTYASPPLLSHLARAMGQPAVAIAEARQIPIEHPKAYDPATGETSWASTCCVLIDTGVFRQVGGFDAEHFPLYCDDVDFAWRVRMAGYRVLHVPMASIFHDKRITADGGVGASETESYYSTFAGLMLARRYGRPDIETQIVTWISGHGEPAQRRALNEFRDRERSGTTPVPLAGAERVAEFVGGAYARHRF